MTTILNGESTKRRRLTVGVALSRNLLQNESLRLLRDGVQVGQAQSGTSTTVFFWDDYVLYYEGDTSPLSYNAEFIPAAGGSSLSPTFTLSFVDRLNATILNVKDDQDRDYQYNSDINPTASELVLYIETDRVLSQDMAVVVYKNGQQIGTATQDPDTSRLFVYVDNQIPSGLFVYNVQLQNGSIVSDLSPNYSLTGHGTPPQT